jgi:hypothetical protein
MCDQPYIKPLALSEDLNWKNLGALTDDEDELVELIFVSTIIGDEAHSEFI